MANGTIPHFQQHPLLEVGKWLRVNGEAIYGTQPLLPIPSPLIPLPAGLSVETKWTISADGSALYATCLANATALARAPLQFPLPSGVVAPTASAWLLAPQRVAGRWEPKPLVLQVCTATLWGDGGVPWASFDMLQGVLCRSLSFSCCTEDCCQCLFMAFRSLEGCRSWYCGSTSKVGCTRPAGPRRGANLKFSTGGIVWPNYPVFPRGLKILFNTRFAHLLYNRLPQLPVPQFLHPKPHKCLIFSLMLTIGPSVPNSAPLAPCWRTRNFKF